ncbi:MAG: threonine ammonia-lyase [Saprospiraceae bacterium]|nr:threonine ammonia-lyase [Haliscomenobacter sp.]MBK7223432.1 threonine ammonia-lyase [Saprospiraceae bacterium]
MITESQISTQGLIRMEDVYKAKVRLRGVADTTPLKVNEHLSEKYGCTVLLKREDLQVVRSYKIRGAYNFMSSLAPEVLAQGIVCASAGNHAQGVALACRKLGAHGKIFMPSVTPQQKINKVKLFGKKFIEVVLTGDTFDDAYKQAILDAQTNKKTFVHPFDDEKVIEGQATVGLEILEDCKTPIDFVFVPVGGGGLISGLGSFFKQASPDTRIIGVEPAGAPSMYESIKAGHLVTLEHIDLFVDGAAVKRVGEKTFEITRQVAETIALVDEGKVCSTILHLYNEEGMVVEPAGALTIAVLDQFQDLIRGKTVVCVVSGGNNDVTRTEEIKERALFYEGRKHYFVIRFPQRAGALRDFLNDVLGPTDNITHFEYTKKHNRDTGPALVGIEVEKKEDYEGLIQRMEEREINFQPLSDSRTLFELLI